jgi:putative peptide zinc metalloprotease protein
MEIRMKAATGSPGRTPATEQGEGQAPQTAQGGAEPPQAAAMPERPTLADGVKLAGQLRESAFKSPPWLLEREGAGYVQVTPLLYSVAEECNGEQDYAQIAEKISAKGQPVRPDTVKRLVAGMLIPLGLVSGPDGSVATTSAKRSSLLSVNMRMKMLAPETVEPVIRLLRWLYWPGVLLAVLALAFASQVWVFAIHGIASSTREALYQPGLLLLVVLFTVLSAAFHELGHAAALHYAGRRIKGMGAGLYLIYPAFYTDVSDNYRLPRWPRVRTDVGGFYFNLVFGLATLGVYLITRQDFLLLLVVLADFEIVYQLQPFIRLDGYWTLADITGIPDFFTQMGAFWRSVLPIKRWKGQKLPELKWWGKLVFVLYTLVTIPLLAFVLFTMVRTVPRVIATALDSGHKLIDQFGAGVAGGHALAAAAAAVQLVLLALPTAGMLLILFTLGRQLTRLLWNWSRPTPWRRISGGLIGAVIVAVIVALWTPQVLSFLPARHGTAQPIASNFQPIGPNDRGTLQEAAAAIPIAGSWVPSSTIATPEATVTATPARSATATATAAATASLTPTAAGRASATPSSTATPARSAASATPAIGTAAQTPAATASPGVRPAPATATVRPGNAVP